MATRRQIGVVGGRHQSGLFINNARRYGDRQLPIHKQEITVPRYLSFHEILTGVTWSAGGPSSSHLWKRLDLGVLGRERGRKTKILLRVSHFDESGAGDEGLPNRLSHRHASSSFVSTQSWEGEEEEEEKRKSDPPPGFLHIHLHLQQGCSSGRQDGGVSEARRSPGLTWL